MGDGNLMHTNCEASAMRTRRLRDLERSEARPASQTDQVLPSQGTRQRILARSRRWDCRCRSAS